MASVNVDIWNRAVEIAEKFGISRQEALERIREQDKVEREERLQERKMEMEYKLHEKKLEMEREERFKKKKWIAKNG